jgi:hypothetical protein
VTTPVSAVDYTAKDFSSIRASMLSYASTVIPEWTSRAPADFGVALVEMLAYSMDVLSYYQDRLISGSLSGHRHAAVFDTGDCPDAGVHPLCGRCRPRHRHSRVRCDAGDKHCGTSGNTDHHGIPAGQCRPADIRDRDGRRGSSYGGNSRCAGCRRGNSGDLDGDAHIGIGFLSDSARDCTGHGHRRCGSAVRDSAAAGRPVDGAHIRRVPVRTRGMARNRLPSGLLGHRSLFCPEHRCCRDCDRHFRRRRQRGGPRERHPPPVRVSRRWRSQRKPQQQCPGRRGSPHSGYLSQNQRSNHRRPRRGINREYPAQRAPRFCHTGPCRHNP